MSQYRNLIRAAAEATEIQQATGFSWFGQRSGELPVSVKKVLTPETARGHLHYRLQSRLYTDFYCSGGAKSQGRDEKTPGISGQTPFVEALSDANSGTGYVAPGWTVIDKNGDKVALRKGGIAVFARKFDCDDPESETESAVGLRFPKEFIHLSPGFYMAVGNLDLSAHNGVLRSYWNLSAQGAVHFVAEATHNLNRLNVPFRLKAIADPARYERCDSVVLYTHACDIDRIASILARICRQLAADLKPEVPALTKPLADGVGVAEDPGGNTSFGLHRCGLIADGLINAFESGTHDLSARLSAIFERFSAEGLIMDYPYLNAGSYDNYPRIAASGGTVSHRHASSPRTIQRADCVETALAIGRRLMEEAIWHRDRCTWLGPEPGPDQSGGAVNRTVYRTLGPDLYAGTSGIAMFLAELHVVTGDVDARTTALGAMSQASAQFEMVPQAARFGFYSGWSGIAVAAARLGVLLDQPCLIDDARDLLVHLEGGTLEGAEPDLLSGVAGGIAAVLVLADLLADQSLLDIARRFGEALLNDAEPADGAVFWRSPGHPENPGLTGFSHGASGIGYALRALSQETGETFFLEAANSAFDFERVYFDAKAKNWPDLRGLALDKPGVGTAPFQTAWCHGAPGIALARLGACSRSNYPEAHSEAHIALATTAIALDTAIGTRNHNFSLCHGLAGNADILLTGHRTLGDLALSDAHLVSAVAELGIRLYARSGHRWPCGIPEETPGLLLGLAGIGHFYLRVANPNIPSVLDPLAASKF